MSINRVMISGNLTRDAELRHTASGMSVLGWSMAINDRRKNQQTGEWEDYPNFVDVTVFGPRADAVSKYMTKGAKVCVEGKLRWSSWEKDGQKRSKIEVIADEIEFLSRSEAAQAPAKAPTANYQTMTANYGQMAPQQPQTIPPSITTSTQSVYDEEIPF